MIKEWYFGRVNDNDKICIAPCDSVEWPEYACCDELMQAYHEGEWFTILKISKGTVEDAIEMIGKDYSQSRGIFEKTFVYEGFDEDPKYSLDQRQIYKKYLKTPLWQNVRQEALKRAGFKCVKCGSAKNLQVHHITYENVGAEQPEDLCVMCKECHEKTHEKDVKEKNMKFEDIVNKEVERRMAEMKEPKTKRCTILMKPSLYEKAKRNADELGMSMGSFISMAVENMVK